MASVEVGSVIRRCFHCMFLGETESGDPNTRLMSPKDPEVGCVPNTASGVASSFPHNRRAINFRFDGSDTGYEPKLLPLRYSAEWSQAGGRTHGAAELPPGGRAQGAAELPPGGRAQGAAELHWPSASMECASATGSRAWLGLRGVSGSLLVTRSYAGGRGALPSCFRVRAAAAQPTHGAGGFAAAAAAQSTPGAGGCVAAMRAAFGRAGAGR